MIEKKLITKDNLDFALKIQKTIFPDFDASSNYLSSINDNKTLKYYLFVFSNCLNIVSVALIAYGIFKDHGLILPACILWLFNWHLFTYYAAEINKNAGKSLINIIRIITGVLVVVGICAQVFGFFK